MSSYIILGEEIKSVCACDLLPSQTMVAPLHCPSASHTELLLPLRHTKPSSQPNVATLANVVPVTDSSTASSTEAGRPQSTTERDDNIQSLPAGHNMCIDFTSGLKWHYYRQLNTQMTFRALKNCTGLDWSCNVTDWQQFVRGWNSWNTLWECIAF